MLIHLCMQYILFQLYWRRSRAVRTEEEQIAWQQLSEAYMTEESDNEAERVVKCHKLSWESYGTVNL